MAFFQAKLGWERQRKRENKNYRSDKFLPNPKQRIQKKKKKAKKLKNLKKTIMASFQETIGWEMMRTSENKNYRSDQFLPDP